MADHAKVKIIRETVEDEITVDLAGYTEASVTDYLKHCFGKPIVKDGTMKVTFVVGGGKLVRQKYEDKLPSYVAAALTSLGYNDDRTADKSCQKAFKHQHDTSKNLLFVHCFPELEAPEVDGNEYDEDGEVVEIPKSPEERVLITDLEEFKVLVQLKVNSYHQLKKLQAHLKDAQKFLTDCETRLSNMKQLTAEEQDKFDNYDSIAEKITFVNKELQKLVENGQLEQFEIEDLLKFLQERVAMMEEQLETSGISEKKKTMLETEMDKLCAQRQASANKDPIDPRPLFREQELRQLYSKLGPLKDLEKLPKHTREQVDKLANMGDLEERVDILVEQSRGWFENARRFEERRKRCEAAGRRMGKAPGAKAKAGGGNKENAWFKKR